MRHSPSYLMLACGGETTLKAMLQDTKKLASAMVKETAGRHVCSTPIAAAATVLDFTGIENAS
jgi:hypothetical protein